MAPVLHLSIAVDDLEAARSFYVDVLGCTPGRVREQWVDVWFFGLQLTLQLRPDEVEPLEPGRARHFGVALDEDDYRRFLDRLDAHDVGWIDRPARHTAAELSAKSGGKLADPSGNVIEIKHYPAGSDFAPTAERSSPAATGS